MSERIDIMRNNLTEKRHISIESLKIILNAYQETSGEPLVKCRARAMYDVLTQIPIFIREGDLLAGNGASRPNCLEIDVANGIWNQFEIDALRADGYTFDEADEQILSRLNETTPPFSLNDGVGQVIDDDSPLMPFLRSGMALSQWVTNRRGRQNSACSAQGGLSLSPAQALVCLDYERVLQSGIRAMVDECKEEIQKIRFFSGEDYARCVYLKAILNCLQGLLEYAARYATLAEDMAARETNAIRAAELRGIAERCRRVPAEPPRTFHEALQMYWFIFHTVACPNSVLGMGRLDQLLYPYYCADKKAGRITDEEAIELFAILRLKDIELGSVGGKLKRDIADGEARWHNVVIGGVKKDGSDATNELSYHILEALMRCPTLHHTITIRVADSTPDELILKGLECIRRGFSMPAFVGDQSYIKYFEYFNVPTEEARDYILTGCLDANLPGKSRSLTASMFIAPMCLDIFLNRGYDRKLDLKWGIDPGDLDQWLTFEDFVQAFKTSFRYYIECHTERCNLMILSMQNYFPEPFKTAFMHNGIKDATDYQIKQMPFENAGVICPVGIVNLGNSLMVIKKVVYEEKLFRLSELAAILQANWEGHDELRRRCLNVAKYGNDIDEVDLIVADMYDYFAEVTESMPCVTGTSFKASAVSITAHAPGGSFTGATPDGRFKGETLVDGGVSPGRGQDVQGPLAVLKSGMKLPQYRYQATLLNMKFHPSALRTQEDLLRLSKAIRVYFAKDGKHIQFNVCDRATLEDAQVNPDKHRDLMVRVAGYSAYFVNLTSRLQGEIIDRTVNNQIS